MSSSLASKSGSGLKVNVRMRCGCKSDSTSIACTVLRGRPRSRASVRTLQRLRDSGCWQTRVCTLCRISGPCLSGRPDRIASPSPSKPAVAKPRRHLLTVADEFAAAIGQDRRASDEARSLLLVDAGGELPDMAALREHGAADRGAAPADRIGRGGGERKGAGNKGEDGNAPKKARTGAIACILPGGREGKMEIPVH